MGARSGFAFGQLAVDHSSRDAAVFSHPLSRVQRARFDAAGMHEVCSVSMSLGRRQLISDLTAGRSSIPWLELCSMSISPADAARHEPMEQAYRALADGRSRVLGHDTAQHAFLRPIGQPMFADLSGLLARRFLLPRVCRKSSALVVHLFSLSHR